MGGVGWFARYKSWMKKDTRRTKDRKDWERWKDHWTARDPYEHYPSKEKTCSMCGETKPVLEFNIERRRKTGLNGRCRDCTKDSSRKWSRKHGQRQYRGIASIPKDWLTARDGNCHLCGKHTKMLHLDHCHETGVARGLLCRTCNTSLGGLGDNEDGLMRALSYLRKFADGSQKNSPVHSPPQRDERRRRPILGRAPCG